MLENENIKVSVIVPVYQTEAYLRQCVDSVIESTIFPACEVILVDDGSTDRSGGIAMEYAGQYANIRVKSQENSGLSLTRNTGMSLSSGEYIFFLDSDDAVQPEYINILYQAAVKYKADIVTAGYSRWDGQTYKARIRPVLTGTDMLTGTEWLEKRMDSGDRENYVWCALYSRDFLTRNEILFDQVWLYEDILFSTRVMLHAERVARVPIYGYLYRSREGSMVQSGVQRRDVEALFIILQKMMKLYDAGNVKQKHCIGRMYFQIISMMLYYIGGMEEEGMLQREEARKYMQRIQELHLNKPMKKAAVTGKEKLKCLIFRFGMRRYYRLVRK